MLILLCSCSDGEEKDILQYQRMPMTVYTALSCDAGDAAVTIRFTDSENYSVTYSEPAVMRGISYELQKGSAYLCFGQTRVPVTEGEACLGSLAMARFFLLDYSMLHSESQDVLDGQNVTVQNYVGDSMSATVWLTEDGLPVKITGEADGFSAALTGIEIKYE